MFAKAIKFYIFDDNNLRSGMFEYSLLCYCERIGTVSGRDIYYSFGSAYGSIAQPFTVWIFTYQPQDLPIVRGNFLYQLFVVLFFTAHVDFHLTMVISHFTTRISPANCGKALLSSDRALLASCEVWKFPTRVYQFGAFEYE